MAPDPDHEPEAAPKPKQRRGHARRDKDGKFMPTGDYPVGFASPPIQHRFDGTQKSPGRPKGARSQESYEREAFDRQMSLTINGVTRKMPKRQIAVELAVKAALANPDKAVMEKALDRAKLLYPERAKDEAVLSPLGNAGLDHMVIQQFVARLSLGEPDPAASELPGEPGTDAPPASLDDGAQSAWDEGNWGDAGSSDGDEPDEDGGDAGAANDWDAAGDGDAADDEENGHD